MLLLIGIFQSISSVVLVQITEIIFRITIFVGIFEVLLQIII